MTIGGSFIQTRVKNWQKAARDVVLRASTALVLAITLLAPSPAVSQTVNKTFSIVVTPKMISDFNNPKASIDAFYANYLNLMQQYTNQLIVFYVSGGDHIFSFPANAFSLDQQQAANPTTTAIFNGTPLNFYYNGIYNHTSPQLENTDVSPAAQSLGEASYEIPVNGAQGLQATFTINPISLSSFPVMQWNWKKVGGQTALIQFRVTSPVYNEGFWIGYYAGQIPPGANNTTWAQFNLGPLPISWTPEHINLLDDLAVFLAHNAPGGNSDIMGDEAATGQWQVTAVALAPYDGTAAYFDTINAVNSTSVPWSRGTANADYASGPYVPFSGHQNYLTQGGAYNPNPAEPSGRAYPQDLTYTQIKNIVQTFKTEGSAFGLNVRVLDGVDAGHEFAFKPWQYGKHPEMLVNNDTIGFYKPLNADPTAYASTYNPTDGSNPGIKQGTLTATFIANQIGAYVNQLGFDGIYSTNGFGLQPATYPFAGSPNFTQATETQAFFQNLKQALGSKLHVWEDSYLSMPIDNYFLNMPTGALQYIDYVQLSSFWQSPDANGDPFIGGWLNPNSPCLNGGTGTYNEYGYGIKGDGVLNAATGNHETLEAFSRDEVQSELALKPTYPNTKFLWVFYFTDPWYLGTGNGAGQKTSAFQQFVNSLDGMMVYSNDYQGNNLAPSLQSRLLGIFSQSQTALTAVPTKPVSNTLGWLEAVSSTGVVGGWSLDTSTPGTPADPTQFHVCAYIDGLPGVGAESPVIGTSIYRADVNAAVGTTGNHGFSWQLPSNYMDGKLHHIYIYGVNSNGLVTSLGNSGMSFTVQ